jgi:hypothetical protein
MRDREDSETDEETEDEPSEREPVARSPKSKSTSKAKSSSASNAGASVGLRIGLAALLGVAVGAAGGWFGHQESAKLKFRAAAAPATVNSSGVPSGPCGTWQKKICDETGAESAACQEAKVATDVLTAPVCEAALEAVPATLAMVKAARASCDTFVRKACGELPQGSPACDMVKQRSPQFPAKHCDDMLKNYDQVIAQLRQIDAQGGMGMPGAQRGPGRPGMRMQAPPAPQ